MKFNTYGKTKTVLAIVMAVITLIYIVSMTGALGSFFKFERMVPVYEVGEDGIKRAKQDANGIVYEKQIAEVSQLSYIWLPENKDYKKYIEADFVEEYNTKHYISLGEQYYAGKGGNPTEEQVIKKGKQLFEAGGYVDEEYNINDIAPILVLLFVLGIVVFALSIFGAFGKSKVVWAVFAAIWGVIAAYCYIVNPAVRLAGKINCLIDATGLIVIQSVLAFVGCAVGVAAMVLAFYSKQKNKKLLLESILKRD